MRLHKDEAVLNIDHAFGTTFNLDRNKTPHAKPAQLGTRLPPPTPLDRLEHHMLNLWLCSECSNAPGR
jgi:hypothetical protein